MADIHALKCIRCGSLYPPASDEHACPRCRSDGVMSNLTVVYREPVQLARRTLPARPASLWRFADFLPVAADAAVSLGEGMTPLMPLGQAELGRVFVKDESRNPTWSFKDRLATVAISVARARGARVIACASSGNAGAAVAAYSARAGLPCVVFTLRDAPGPMLAQIRSYGAMAVAASSKDDRWTLLAGAVRRHGWFATSPFTDPPIGSNPYGIEGYKTLAYEIAEQLDWQAPDWCCLPVCYGDALFGVWKGFDELLQLGWIDKRPRLIAAEVSGSLEMALAKDLEAPPNISDRRPSIAISIDASRSTYQAVFSLRQSNGLAVAVPDEEIAAWRNRLATEEGLFVEASSATAFAAIDRLRRAGVIGSNDTVVSVSTASGLKDATPTPRHGEVPLVPADIEVMTETLARHYDFHV